MTGTSTNNFSKMEKEIYERMNKGECALEIASHFFIPVVKVEKYIFKIESKLKQKQYNTQS